jgi:hypothetical protein
MLTIVLLETGEITWSVDTKMQIEIGKEYAIYPKFKKSYVEREVFKDNDSEDRVVVETLWRSGVYLIKVTNEEDKETLEAYMSEDATGDMEPCEFEENEFVESFDGCGMDIYVHLAEGSEADEDEMQEQLEEEGHDWFWENNYDSWDAEHFFGLPLQVDEVDPDNRYDLRF